jgi:hypothetical protein
MKNKTGHVQGTVKILKTVVKDTHIPISKEFGHHFPVIQIVSFLE